MHSAKKCRAVVAILFACVAAIGCGGESPGSNDAGPLVDSSATIDASLSDANDVDTSSMIDASRMRLDAGVPVNHRLDDSICRSLPPKGTCVGSALGSCKKDSNCTMGVNGRCNVPTTGAAACACEYEACADDTSCPSDFTCACHNTTYNQAGGNTCVPSNCRMDSDCGPEGYCSPSFDTMTCSGVAGYFCHTPNDQCENDSDCAIDGGVADCVYDAMLLYFTCTNVVACH